MASKSTPRLNTTHIHHHLALAVLFAVTWPYYRSLVYRTTKPISDLRTKTSLEDVRAALDVWIQGKREEYRNVSAAATVSAVGAVAIFSWPSIEASIWYAKALLYVALLVAIWALIAVGQGDIMLDQMVAHLEAAQLPDNKSRSGSNLDTKTDANSAASPSSASSHTVAPPPTTTTTTTPAAAAASTPVNSSQLPLTLPKTFDDLLDFVLYRRPNPTGNTASPPHTLAEELSHWHLRKTALFLWQYPLMLMAYSWTFLITALSLHVAQPLWRRRRRREGWHDDCKVAVVYLAFLGLCVAQFFASAAYGHFGNFEPGEKRRRRGS